MLALEALSVGIPRMKLSSVYRVSKIRRISGFRIVLVLTILAKTIVIDLLADKMSRIPFRHLEYPEQTLAIKEE